MNLTRPFVVVAGWVVAFAPALLQIAGLGLLVAAMWQVWGGVGGLIAAGVSLVVVGVAVELGRS